MIRLIKPIIWHHMSFCAAFKFTGFHCGIRNNLTGSFDSFVAKLNLIASYTLPALNILDDHDSVFFLLSVHLKLTCNSHCDLFHSSNF